MKKLKIRYGLGAPVIGGLEAALQRSLTVMEGHYM